MDIRWKGCEARGCVDGVIENDRTGDLIFEMDQELQSSIASE